MQLVLQEDSSHGRRHCQVRILLSIDCLGESYYVKSCLIHKFLLLFVLGGNWPARHCPGSAIAASPPLPFALDSSSWHICLSIHSRPAYFLYSAVVDRSVLESGQHGGGRAE